MNEQKVKLHRALLLAGVVLGLAGLAWFFAASAGSAYASPMKRVIAAPVAGIRASQVLTDAYEPNDNGPGVWLGSTYGPGILCSSPLPIVTDASLYKFAGIDVDYYNLNVAGNSIYTISVVSQNTQVTVPVHFILVIQSRYGDQVAAQTAITPSTSFFAPVSGSTSEGVNFRILIQAQNPNFDPRDQAYAVTLCSSPAPVTATPTPSSTPYGNGPDPFEPNDTPAQVLQRPGGIVSYINVGSQIANVNFYPSSDSGIPVTVTGAAGDTDWYFFYAKKSSALGGAGGCFEVGTAVQPGVDTALSVYPDPPIAALAYNDDASFLNRSSVIRMMVPADGRYWIKVINLDSSPRGPGQNYNIYLLERASNLESCPVLYPPRAYLPIQIAWVEIVLPPPTSTPAFGEPVPTPTPPPAVAEPVPTFTPPPLAYPIGPVIVSGPVYIANVNAAAGTAFDEYLDLLNTGSTPVTLVDWKIRVGGQVYNLSNPVGTQLQLLAQQGCRVYTGTNVGPVALPGEYAACGARYLGVTSGTKIYPNTSGYQIELLNESNVVVAYYGR